MELSNSLFSEDQNLWPSGDLGIAPDLQVYNNKFKFLLVCRYLIKHLIVRYIFIIFIYEHSVLVSPVIKLCNMCVTI